MAWIDSSQPQQSFNYQTETDKLKRQRELAAALMSAKQPGTQTVPGGPNGFVVRNSALSNLGPMLQQLVGAYLQGKNDDTQKQIDADSLSAFGKQYAGLGAGVRDPNQDGVEAAAEMQREARRGQGSGVEGGEMTGSPAPEEAQTFPIAPQTPDNSKPLPVQSITPQARSIAASALSGAPDPSSQVEQQVIGDSKPAPDMGVGSNARGIDRANRAAMAARILATQGQVAGPGRGLVNPPLAAQMPAPQAPQPTAMPPMAPQQGPLPSMAPPQAAPQPQMPPQPMPNPQAGPAMPSPQAQTSMPVPSAPDQPMSGPGSAEDPYSRAPNQGEQIQRLIALGRTGPEGQQIAQQALNQMFSSKNGRYKTDVHADPVNGGFIQVTTDTATGRSQVSPIGSAGGAEKVLDTKIGADGNLMERTAKGWRPAQMQGGGSVMTNEGQQQQQTEATKKAEDGNAINSLKAARDNLQELVPLIKKVGTGRLQSSWNGMKAFVTDSTDLDNMNRLFNTQQLQAAVDTMKGQGSISDSERRILSSSQFDPKASTQSNIDYANRVLPILQKHIDLLQGAYDTKYSSGSSSSSAPQGMMYSWQKK